MSKRIYIFLSIICGFAFVVQGCNERVDEPILVDNDIELSVAPSIGGVAATAVSSGVAATATKSVFADGDRFSLYLSLTSDDFTLAPNELERCDYSNIEYQCIQSGAKAVPAVSGRVVYYPYGSTAVNLWGIYPYDAAASAEPKDAAAYEWSVNKDQSTAATLVASDLLVASRFSVAPSESSPEALNFEHKMSRLQLRLTIPLEVDGNIVSASAPVGSVSFEGMKLGASYNFYDDVTTVSSVGEAQSITPLFMGSEAVNAEVPAEGTAHYYEAVVVPQEVGAGSNLLLVTLNYEGGGQELFAMPLGEGSDFLLVMGRQTLLDVDFDTYFSLRLNSVRVLEWQGEDDAGGDDIPQTILIDGVKWATGNLIANGANGCKIGAPADAGLYFQFGKLVGWSGGTTGDGSGMGETSLRQRVKPTGYVGSTLWDKNNENSGDYSSDNAPLGTGDPCRYYLGAAWRTPTTAEYATLVGKTGSDFVYWDEEVKGKWSPFNDVDGGWFGDGLSSGSGDIDPLKQIFFSASGVRRWNDGSFNDWAPFGYYYWSSSVYDTEMGYKLTIDSEDIRAQAETYRSYGFPVRCVNSPPPPPPPSRPDSPDLATEAVPINSLYWAKGNLVSDGSGYWCEIGAPTDGGLYFQFGSLVGWSGGATGDGRGAVPAGADLALDRVPALAISVQPIGYTDETTWAGHFTYDDIYEDDDVAEGVGDPCRYYLEGDWRTPTKEEFVALFGGGNKSEWVNVPNWSWRAPYAYYAGDKLRFGVSGARNSSDGSFYGVDSYGYYWGSSEYDVDSGYCLTLYNSRGVFPQNNLSRSYGFPVRCVHPR